MKTLPLGKLVTITIGKTPPRGDPVFWDSDKSGKNAWLSIRDLQILDDGKVLDSSEYISDKGAKLFKPVPKGTLLVSFKLTLGRLAFAGRDIYTNEAIAALHNDGKTISDEYLYYYLSYFDWYEYAKSDMKVKGLTLNKTKLNNLPIVFPESIEEQHRISQSLNVTTKEVEAVRKLNTQNILSIDMLFDAKFDELFSKPYPNSQQVTLSDVCDIGSVLVDPRTSPCLDLLHVGGANIESRTGNLMNLKTAREESLISGKFMFNEDVVLYSKIRPYLRKVARPNFSGLCSADIYPLTPKKGMLSRDFLFYLLLSSDFTNYAISGSDRAGMPKVNRPHLFKYRFDLPPLEQQEQIVAVLGELARESRELRHLYEEKDRMLQVLKVSFLHQALGTDYKI